MIYFILFLISWPLVGLLTLFGICKIEGESEVSGDDMEFFAIAGYLGVIVALVLGVGELIKKLDLPKRFNKLL